MDRFGGERRYRPIPPNKEALIKTRIQALTPRVASLRQRLQNGELLPERFDENIVRMIVARELLTERAKLRDLIDDKTQLPNSKWFGRELQERIERVKKEGGSIGIIMLDIDNFGEINKRIGQQAGDEVLRQVALQIELNTRLEDFPARWGGEEFIVITEVEDPQILKDISERIRKGVAEGSYGNAGSQSVSMGGTIYTDGERAEDFIQRANNAMILSKNTGKNKVSIPELGK
ncbi:GGDEF domain-containing protein [Candidatus Gottesmanbacteria bacterium]|nr:GGDEF domain-containing protein [Candidatus Gottesmanbacteria bacterium]